jgi:hypothetical protein
MGPLRCSQIDNAASGVAMAPKVGRWQPKFMGEGYHTPVASRIFEICVAAFAMKTKTSTCGTASRPLDEDCVDRRAAEVITAGRFPCPA